MNKILKVFFVNTILVMIMLIYSQNNVSYCQSYNKIEELIKIQDKVEYLEGKIQDINEVLNVSKDDTNNKSVVYVSFIEKNTNMNSLKKLQIKSIKKLFETQLADYENYEDKLIYEITSEKENIMQTNNVSYIKGQWPLENYTYVSSYYGYRIHPISKELSFHTGIDIPAPKNTDVLASDDGIIIYAGYTNGYGNLVKIEHFDGKVTVYAHNNKILVKEGQVVKKGQVISKVGTTGNSTGNHVHFEVIVKDKRINPMDGVTKDM